MNDRDYPTEAGEALNSLKNDLIKEAEKRFSSEWKVDDESEEIDGVIKKTGLEEWEDFVPYGCEGRLPYTPEQLLEPFKDDRLRILSIESCDSIEDIEQIDDEVKIQHVIYKLPFPLSDRDFVCLNLKALHNGELYILNRAATHSAKPKNDDYERGRACTDIKISRDPTNPSHSVMKISVLNDMSGLLPAWVQNQINKTAKTAVIGFREGIEKYLKETGKEIQQLDFLNSGFVFFRDVFLYFVL